MKKLILFLFAVLFVFLLTACKDGGGKGKPTPEPATETLIGASVELKTELDDSEFPPEPDYPIPGDPTPTPEPCSLVIAAWPRYEPDPWDIQEIGVELICDGYSLEDEIVTVCVDTACMDVHTDEQGNAVVQFPRTWGIGAVPYSACVDGVCLRSSFMAEAKGDQ